MSPDDLAALHAQSFTTPRPWSAAEFASLITSLGVFLITERQGFVLGRAVAGEAELLTIAVAPEARRQGIGTRLLAAFLHRAAAEGAATAFLEVASGNAAAIDLYRAAGFAEAGRRRGYYTIPGKASEDAIVMRLDLPPGKTR